MTKNARFAKKNFKKLLTKLCTCVIIRKTTKNVTIFKPVIKSSSTVRAFQRVADGGSAIRDADVNGLMRAVESVSK